MADPRLTLVERLQAESACVRTGELTYAQLQAIRQKLQKIAERQNKDFAEVVREWENGELSRVGW